MWLIGFLFLIAIILFLWYAVNVMNKPILNRMHNYYEDDKDGKKMANILIGAMLIIAFILGLLAG